MELELEPREAELLIWAIPNEVINGFKVDDFYRKIGASESEFKGRTNRLRQTPGDEHLALETPDVRVFRNVLALTLEELGVDEFQTRTGFEFDMGQRLLVKLDRFFRAEDELDG